MYKGIQVKLYPNQTQKELINKTFGHTRFVWNQMLNMLNERYKNNPELPLLSYSKLSSFLPQLKREYEWLKEVDAVAVQKSVKTLRETFDRFFEKVSKYPRFKSEKMYAQTYTTVASHNNLRVNKKQNYIKLPKLGWVQCQTSLFIENEFIKSITVKRLATGEYTASVLVEFENQEFDKTDKTVGIDLGVSDLAITSNGQRFKSQRLHLKYKKQLHDWEKRVARRRIQAKNQGLDLREAKNYQRARKQVARLHRKIANTRKDYLHKITTQLVKEYDVIAMEDLKTAHLLKNHTLTQSISNQSWRMFRTFLEYKCERYGKELRVVNPYKTSQICSQCSYDDGKHPLNIREWTCPSCHTYHDRDVNAAKNIERLGLGQALVK